jgi:hypothetical protein
MNYDGSSSVPSSPRRLPPYPHTPTAADAATSNPNGTASAAHWRKIVRIIAVAFDHLCFSFALIVTNVRIVHANVEPGFRIP